MPDKRKNAHENAPDYCPRCDAVGAHFPSCPNRCKTCDGDDGWWFRDTDQNGRITREGWQVCPSCKGGE